MFKKKRADKDILGSPELSHEASQRIEGEMNDIKERLERRFEKFIRAGEKYVQMRKKYVKKVKESLGEDEYILPFNVVVHLNDRGMWNTPPGFFVDGFMQDYREIWNEVKDVHEGVERIKESEDGKKILYGCSVEKRNSHPYDNW